MEQLYPYSEIPLFASCCQQLSRHYRYCKKPFNYLKKQTHHFFILFFGFNFAFKLGVMTGYFIELWS